MAPLWAAFRLSCRFQTSGVPVIHRNKNKFMISAAIVGRWTSLVSSYVCSSPQEGYRAINSINTQQIPYRPCDRNKHTPLPTWTCPFGINGDSEWRTCCNYPCILYALDIYTGLLPSLLHCAGALQNHFQSPRGLEYSLKAWNNTASSRCPVSVKQQFSVLGREGCASPNPSSTSPSWGDLWTGRWDSSRSQRVLLLTSGWKQTQESRWSDPCLLSLGFLEKFIARRSLKDVCLFGGIWLYLLSLMGVSHKLSHIRKPLNQLTQY